MAALAVTVVALEDTEVIFEQLILTDLKSLLQVAALLKKLIEFQQVELLLVDTVVALVVLAATEVIFLCIYGVKS